MGVGRTTIKNIAGSTTFSGLTDVDVAGSQQGSVLFYNGSKWVDLAPATTNQVLTTNGAGANPSWTNKTSATGIVGGTDRMVQFNDGGSTFGGVAHFEFQKLTNNLMVSGSSGYSYSARASGSSQTTSGLDVFNYDNSQVLQVGHNNSTNESYVWATQTSNNLKFGTNNIKRMEILASNGKIFTTNDFHVSGTLTAATATLIGTDTLWNAKGDLAVGTGSDTAVRVSIGSDGKVLTADSTTTSGVDWVTPAAAASTNDLRIPVGSSSGGGLATKFVSSPFIIDAAGGPYADGNVVMTSDGSNVSSAGLGKLALITETGSTSFASVASGAAATVARLGSITNHTSTVEFLHNGKEDILSKIVMTSGTTTIGAESPHKFILTGGLGITAQSTKPTDSTTKPAIWVSGTSNLLYLSDVGMVTANSSVLSAGYVPYVSGAAKNGVGNSVLYNDATNSRIGINTASPNRAFDVRGTSLLSGNTKVVGTGEITSTLDVGSNITGTGTATFKTASLTNIVLDPTTRAAFIKLQDSSRTTTTASRNPEILLNQVLVDSGSDKADFPTIRFTKGGPVAVDGSYTNLGYRIYVSGETGAGTPNSDQAMIWDFNSDIADPANYIEKLALTTTGGLRINNAYTLPTVAAGSNGYVITGNTDGTTGWAAQSGGGVGGYWGLNGSKIHYTSGNVGIITNDPQAPLHVSGNVIFGSGASSVLDRVNIGDTTKGIYGYNNRLDFYISSNPRLHLDAGTLFSATSGGPSMDLTPGPAGTANYGFVDDTDTGMTRSAANTLHLLTAGVSGMTMDSSQNVGIGTTPTANIKLTISDSTDTFLQLKPQATHNTWSIGADATGLAFYDSTVGGYRMNISDAGNVGIGTTGPDAKLDVLSTTEQLRLTHTDASKYMSTAVDSNGSTIWTNQKSFRFTGEQTDGVFQIDQNKISLVRDTDSVASSVLQIGDHTTYDQFSILEDQRGSTATNGLLYLRSKKTGNAGYATVALGAISGSNTSYLYVNGISTNEALRFDTNTKSHALDIAKAGYVSIGAAVSTTDALYVNGNTTINGVLTATAKSFDIPHPDKEGKRLVHGSLEGPEHGVYARGTAKGHGETTIELPDYWKTLVGDDYTLQLTSYNSSNIYIVEKEATSFTINSNSLNYKFDYVVIGRREEIEVEQNGN